MAKAETPAEPTKAELIAVAQQKVEAAQAKRMKTLAAAHAQPNNAELDEADSKAYGVLKKAEHELASLL